MAAEPPIRTVALTRRYGSKLACDRVSLEVPGGVFGLLGRNGAGKTTVVKLLMGLVRPTSGEARVFGHPAGSLEARRLVGFLPENFRYPDWATGGEVLRFHCALAGVAPERRTGRVAHVLQRVGLGREGGRAVRGYSKGMQQRLGLACALLADPPLLILDEPTSALDPVGRREVRMLLQELAAGGTTILLNSHLLSEVEMVCDRVAFIRDGVLVASGAMADFTRRGLEVEVVAGGGAETAARALAALGPSAVEPLPEPGRCRLRVSLCDADQVPAVAEALVGAGVPLYGLQLRRQSLEDLFVELTGEGGPAAPR